MGRQWFLGLALLKTELVSAAASARERKPSSYSTALAAVGKASWAAERFPVSEQVQLATNQGRSGLHSC
jgi:hypothetical protein